VLTHALALAQPVHSSAITQAVRFVLCCVVSFCLIYPMFTWYVHASGTSTLQANSFWQYGDNSFTFPTRKSCCTSVACGNGAICPKDPSCCCFESGACLVPQLTQQYAYPHVAFKAVASQISANGRGNANKFLVSPIIICQIELFSGRVERQS
jgi:hypothetical protein